MNTTHTQFLLKKAIQNILREGELVSEAVVRKSRTTASDGKSRQPAVFCSEKPFVFGWK